MYSFDLSLAGFCIRCEVNYEYSLRFCRRFITEEDADFSVSISAEEIESEKRRYKEYDSRNQSAAYYENLALYRKICSELALRDCILIHGSSLMMDGQAYLFCAPSGTGKSTHTRLWREAFGDRVVMINDDKPIVRFTPDGIARIYGTPWNGKHNIGENTSAPLKFICFIERGEKNSIRPLDRNEGVGRMLKFCFRPDDALQTAAMMGTADKISGYTAFRELKCNMDPDAAMVSYEGMNGK